MHLMDKHKDLIFFCISQLGNKLAIAKFMCSVICIFLSLVNEATKNIASCSFRSLCCILRSFKTGNSVCIQHQLLLILPLPPLRRRAALKRNTLGKHQNTSCNENQYSFYQNLIPNIFVCPAEENASLKSFLATDHIAHILAGSRQLEWITEEDRV